MTVIPDRKIEQLKARHKALEDRMADPGSLSSGEFAGIAREYAELSPVVAGLDELLELRRDAADLDEMIADPSTDADMRALIEDELRDNRARLPVVEQRLKILLLPKDAADHKNAILEVRAGTGGDEAALFAGELFRMYQRYAELREWKFEIMSASESSLGGFKEATALIGGRGAFARLKYESGVHRVQRVPETESSGRIHTSAATVAVLPEAEAVDVDIDEKDLRIDIFRASGPGGQSVNTTDSAVRITHVPTGIVVQQQDEKSQHKNKAKAMKVLMSRIYEAERQRKAEERAEARRGLIGSGDRSERIRTYNFPQSRVTDHRVNLTIHKLGQVLAGEALDILIDALITEDQATLLAAVEGDGS